MNRASSLQSDCECENVTDRDQNARKFFFNREKTFANGKEKILSSADITGDPHFPNASLPQAEQQLLHSLFTWTRRAIFRANGCTLPSRRRKLSGLRVARRDRRMNAAAHIEVADHGHFARLARLNEIVENLVDHGFVESAFVAIGPQIELQRFKLDAELDRERSGFESWRNPAVRCADKRR